jgi:hypothetical protein
MPGALALKPSDSGDPSHQNVSDRLREVGTASVGVSRMPAHEADRVLVIAAQQTRLPLQNEKYGKNYIYHLVATLELQQIAIGIQTSARPVA